MTAHPAIIRAHWLWAGEGTRPKRKEGQAGREEGGAEKEKKMKTNCEQITSSHVSRKYVYKSMWRDMANMVCQQDPHSSLKFSSKLCTLDFLWTKSWHILSIFYCCLFHFWHFSLLSSGSEMEGNDMFVSMTNLKSHVHKQPKYT